MLKWEGGLQLPDIRLYNLAALLRHIKDWTWGTSYFSASRVEQELTQPWELTSLLHTRLKDIPPQIKGSMLLRDTIMAWKTIRKIDFQYTYRQKCRYGLYQLILRGDKIKCTRNGRGKGLIDYKIC